MAVIIPALGAVVGYLGAEVAEENIFERLLWPQRFYNYIDPGAFVKLALFLPMSGPIHKAALTTLDGFRDHGLYRGFLRGDMLGTAFFAEHKGVDFFHRTAPADKRDVPESIRNGFWFQVLKEVERRQVIKTTSHKVDIESSPASSPSQRSRTVKHIFRLSLRALGPGSPRRRPDAIEVSEAYLTASTFLGIFASELSTLGVAVATGLWIRLGSDESETPNAWLVGYLIMPVFLRFAAALLAVRREGIYGRATEALQDTSEDSNQDLQSCTSPRMSDETAPLPAGEKRPESPAARLIASPRPFSSDYREMVEIYSPSVGFVLMSSESPASSTTFQFFRHYGHPERSTFMDRIRETVSIAIVYLFVLYFPVGLFALSWTNETTQYIWLAQQFYCVLAMHIVRLIGWQGCSRTEERVAKILERNECASLVGEQGCVEATLEVEEVRAVRQGRERVKDILQNNSSL